MSAPEVTSAGRPRIGGLRIGKRLDNAASGWYYIGIAFAIGYTPVQGVFLCELKHVV